MWQCAVSNIKEKMQEKTLLLFFKFGDYMNIDYRKQKNEKINNVERDIW